MLNAITDPVYRKSNSASCCHCESLADLAPFFVHVVISPNINRFSKFFHCQNQKAICNKTVIIDPPHLKCVTTLPCEMSVS